MQLALGFFSFLLDSFSLCLLREQDGPADPDSQYCQKKESLSPMTLAERSKKDPDLLA